MNKAKQVPFATDELGEPLTHLFHDTSTLILGDEGMGKSSTLDVVMRELTRSTNTMFVGIGRDVTYGPFSPRFAKLHFTLVRAEQTLVELAAEVANRQELIRLAQQEGATLDTTEMFSSIYLIIDDYGDVGGNSPVAPLFNYILKRGATVQVFVILVSRKMPHSEIHKYFGNRLVHTFTGPSEPGNPLFIFPDRSHVGEPGWLNAKFKGYQRPFHSKVPFVTEEESAAYEAQLSPRLDIPFL